MGSKSSAPQAPNPTDVAAANQASTEHTAGFNATLNRPNVYTPYGNQTWTKTGVDDNGAALYSQNISVAPNAQSAINANIDNSAKIAGLGNYAVDHAQGALSTPFFGSPVNVQSRIYDGNLDNVRQEAQRAAYGQQTSMLDPQYVQGKEALDSQLANQGITSGSKAFNDAQNNFARQRDFAYSNARNSSILEGNNAAQQDFGRYTSQAQFNNQASQQALAQALQTRELPLNELASIRSGSQVNTPSFQATPVTNAANTDVAGIMQNGYQNQLNGYNANQSSANAAMSGLFGLGSSFLGSNAGSAGLMSLFSDRRLKADIQPIAKIGKFVWYSYRYKFSPVKQIGVMADEVKKILPSAVKRHPSGFDMVDYAQVQ